MGERRVNLMNNVLSYFSSTSQKTSDRLPRTVRDTNSIPTARSMRSASRDLRSHPCPTCLHNVSKSTILSMTLPEISELLINNRISHAADFTSSSLRKYSNTRLSKSMSTLSATLCEHNFVHPSPAQLRTMKSMTVLLWYSFLVLTSSSYDSASIALSQQTAQTTQGMSPKCDPVRANPGGSFMQLEHMRAPALLWTGCSQHTHFSTTGCSISEKRNLSADMSTLP